MLLQPTILLLFLFPSVLAAFTYKDRVYWGLNSVVRTDAGTLCFEPQGKSSKQNCADSFLKNLLHVHLTSTAGRSIVYYDNKTNVLGAATWPIPHDMARSVFVCMTGQLVDDRAQYRTICREAYGDDDMAIPAAHTRECVSDEKPQRAGDGCFSIGKPPGSKDDDKEWHEQPIYEGLFSLLGALVTIERVCLLVVSGVRLVVGLFPGLITVFAAVFELLAHRWRRAVVPLPMQQPAAIA